MDNITQIEQIEVGGLRPSVYSRKYGALSSSEDPQKLADTIKGVIKVVGGLVAYFGYTSMTGDINSIADQIGTVVTLGYTFYGAAETLYGLVKKLVIKIAAQ